MDYATGPVLASTPTPAGGDPATMVTADQQQVLHRGGDPAINHTFWNQSHLYPLTWGFVLRDSFAAVCISMAQTGSQIGKF